MDWQVKEGYRFVALPALRPGRPGFSLVPDPQTGIRFTNRLSDQLLAKNSNFPQGSGVALGDVDGDGLCDIYLCGLERPNALYRNLGNWKFEDITARAGVACAGQFSRGATFADLDGDGDLDLIVTALDRGVRCFFNDGKGHFTETTSGSGLTTQTGSTSLALGDLDGDGDLDLYVAHFGEKSILRDGGEFTIKMVGDRPVVMGRYASRLRIVDGHIVESGEPDVLYLNDGKGRFTPVSWSDGTFLDENGRPMSPPLDFGLAVQIRDINEDGFPDIYVCNDFQTPDRIWINDGRGRFRALERLALRSTSFASMGVDFADLDRDGHLDFFVAEMLSRQHARRLRQMSPNHPTPAIVGEIDNRPQIARNTLYWNRGDQTFAEIAEFSGVAASDWSWTPIFLDVDLDGFEDLLVTNGHAHDVNDLDLANLLTTALAGTRKPLKDVLAYPRLETPNAAFRNRGDLTFEETGAAWGFNSLQVSHGAALADLDNDGDLDVVINCWNAPPLLYRNESSAPRVAVRLKGRAPNTFGIGAKVKVSGGPVVQSQEMICGGRYLSGDDSMRVFAAGSLTNELTIEVIWRNGLRSVVPGAKANHLYEIDEAAARPVPNSQPSTPRLPLVRQTNSQPFFKDVSELISHQHAEEPFDDFARQPLLTKRLSQSGPGVAWHDLNGDGYDELIIGSGRGGALGVFQNNGQGGFNRLPMPNLTETARGDLTGVVGWTSAEGRSCILVGLSNYETGASNAPAILRYHFNQGLSADSNAPPAAIINSGPLAVADIDGDGDLDLFVGGGAAPGRYPEATASLLLRNENGRLLVDREQSRLWQDLGLINGAVFSDLNGDGQPDLVLATDWGPVRVFFNERGKFREVTRDLGLANYLGWWNGVTTGDLDGDGQLDIIATNWGLNSSCQASPAQPLRLYYGDLDGNGTLDVLEAYYEPIMKKIVPRRNLLVVGEALPFVRAKFATHKAYAEAGVSEILGEALAKAEVAQAGTLESMVFFNRGNRFEAAALPREAQWAPAFGVSVGDLDGDGNEDLFLSQNFFATRTEDARLDAGRGLWLRGDGRGHLSAVPGQESGVKVYGEQRGCALGDFDGDGRVDLVVTQNGAATKLLRNTGAKPGLRVRLAGPPGNPTGVGATVRLMFGQRPGPAREVHAGSGYWSQDSAVQVMGTPERPTQVWVRWPGGKIVTGDLPLGASEIVVDSSGAITLLHGGKVQ